LEYPDVDGKIILKRNLSGMGWHGLDWSGLEYGHVAGSCKCGKEISVSIKYGESLDWLRNCYLLKKDSAPWSY
jgi:CO dehydrogenase/acetyl-CoA synthase beta subunit